MLVVLYRRSYEPRNKKFLGCCQESSFVRRAKGGHTSLPGAPGRGKRSFVGSSGPRGCACIFREVLLISTLCVDIYCWRIFYCQKSYFPRLNFF